MNKLSLIVSLLCSSFVFAAPIPGKKEATQKPSYSQMFWELVKELPEIILKEEIPVPVYGNYCGPNHGDPSYEDAPIDEVDAVCMRHDMCYDNRVGGLYQSCDCDRDMVVDLGGLLIDGSELDMKAKGIASAMIAWFIQFPCKVSVTSGETALLDNPRILERILDKML